ncbi:hypothetical protein BDP27DRAFT_1360474 [Rhodocollybia butyracea]|uniref:Uncharacterized protein n=1 Tax=Rhodocollybia butyracea TaxID=206335 RepID=A0A9P5Q0J2_9AGAR|nr:hypothetical protein BDP27DRAFT_1360474 [Rhodocollybia butyracea]
MSRTSYKADPIEMQSEKSSSVEPESSFVPDQEDQKPHRRSPSPGWLDGWDVFKKSTRFIKNKLRNLYPPKFNQKKTVRSMMRVKDVYLFPCTEIKLEKTTGLEIEDENSELHLVICGVCH